MQLTLSDAQLKAVEKACSLYGRIKMLQFDFVLEDLLFPDCNFPQAQAFETYCRDFIKENFPDKYNDLFQNRNKEGQIAFEIGRGIHAYHHGHKAGQSTSCCPCWRSELNLSGEPVIKVE